MQGSSSTDGGQGITGKEEVGGGGGDLKEDELGGGLITCMHSQVAFRRQGLGAKAWGPSAYWLTEGSCRAQQGRRGRREWHGGRGRGGEQETTLATCLMNYEKQRTGKRGQQGWKESGVHGRAQLNALCDSGRQ